MKTKLILFSVFICIAHFVRSQDSAVIKFEQRTLFDFGNEYQINGREIKNKELKLLLNKYPDASAEFSISKKKYTIDGLILLGTLSLDVAGLIIYKNNKSLAEGFAIGAACLFFAIDFPITFSAHKHFQKSVWLYNKNVMAY